MEPTIRTASRSFSCLPTTTVSPWGKRGEARGSSKRDGDDIVGCVYLYQLTAEEGEVKRLYVRDTYRGLGLGRRLMQTLIGFATETGYSTLQLSTTPVMQDAQELYQQLGFTETDGRTSVSNIPIDEITYMEMFLE